MEQLKRIPFDRMVVLAIEFEEAPELQKLTGPHTTRIRRVVVWVK